MSEEKFQNEADLKAWLITKGVDEEDAETAAPTLHACGFVYPSALIGITSADLKESGLAVPLAYLLCNKLAKEQQQNGELRCCSRIHFRIQVVVEYENNPLALLFSYSCIQRANS
jgi:hypothetical protein